MDVEARVRRLEDALTVEAELLVRHERLDEERHWSLKVKRCSE
jgi:hypothetical protein